MKIHKLVLATLIGGLVALGAAPSRAAVNAETVQKIVKTGVATTNISATVATDTFTFQNDGRTFLHFVKTGANNCTVTVIAQATWQGLSLANLTFSVPATTGDVFAGPFPPSVFNDSNANVSFTTSEETGLTFAILHLGN